MLIKRQERPGAGGALAWLQRLVKDHIICEVPGDIYLCEYDCRRLQCTAGEWATCERRLGAAAGELMPPGHVSETTRACLISPSPFITWP